MQDDSGETILFRVVRYFPKDEKTTAVKLLLRHSVDVATVNAQNKTALMVALENGVADASPGDYRALLAVQEYTRLSPEIWARQNRLLKDCQNNALFEEALDQARHIQIDKMLASYRRNKRQKERQERVALASVRVRASDRKCILAQICESRQRFYE